MNLMFVMKLCKFRSSNIYSEIQAHFNCHPQNFPVGFEPRTFFLLSAPPCCPPLNMSWDFSLLTLNSFICIRIRLLSRCKLQKQGNTHILVITWCILRTVLADWRCLHHSESLSSTSSHTLSYLFLCSSFRTAPPT